MWNEGAKCSVAGGMSAATVRPWSFLLWPQQRERRRRSENCTLLLFPSFSLSHFCSCWLRATDTSWLMLAYERTLKQYLVSYRVVFVSPVSLSMPSVSNVDRYIKLISVVTYIAPPCGPRTFALAIYSHYSVCESLRTIRYTKRLTASRRISPKPFVHAQNKRWAI